MVAPKFSTILEFSTIMESTIMEFDCSFITDYLNFSPVSSDDFLQVLHFFFAFDPKLEEASFSTGIFAVC